MRASPHRKPGAVLYRDATQPVAARVRDLLGRMTLAEKVRQMSMVKSVTLMEHGRVSPSRARELFKDIGIGELEDPRLLPRDSAVAVNALQELLVRETRLGIPALIYGEGLHGHFSQGTTVFPQAIGLASTWDPALLRRIATCIAAEARAAGVTQGVGPVLDLALDPRWGRTEETYGEDHFLAGRLGVAFVAGLQGGKGAVGKDHVAAMLKHFAAYGASQGGLNMGVVSLGERELREVHLAPFEAAVVEAGALSVMPAYHEIDGVPCSVSELLLRQILRAEWGFQGYTFSDYSAIRMLVDFHHTADNLAEAGRLAVAAGMDMEGPRIEAFGDLLRAQVEAGQVPVRQIDEAVARILRAKFLLGLFENPYVDPDRAARVVNCAAHRRLARRAAQEAIVLLKNEGDLLPLERDLRCLAIVGPNAGVAELGDYCFAKPGAVSPLDGIRQAVSRRTRVVHAPGCGIHELSTDGFAAAVAAAQQADVAIVVVGEASLSGCGVEWIVDGRDTRPPTCGESYDRAELDLPGVQEDLVRAVVATGTPTVVVLVNGRPNSIPWIAAHAPAVIEAWYPGEEGGNALADILFGKVNPSGKLPISIPRTVGQLPVYHDHKPSARGYSHQPGSPGAPGRDYVFTDPQPLYAFGHGLSYTRFEYSGLRVTPATLGPRGRVRVSVTVRNAGRRAGKEVVQLYVRDLVSSVSTPVRALRAFRKIALDPGQVRTVSFVLTRRHLSLLNRDLERVVEPGTFAVTVGGLAQRFTVSTALRVRQRARRLS
jgi:beta-glucosidase